MNNLYRLKFCGFCGLLCLVFGLSQAVVAAEDGGAADAPGAQVIPRGSTLTTHVQRGESLQTFESVLWFEVGGERRWLVERPAIGTMRGAVLMIAAEGDSANGSGQLPALRRYLPDYGWHTYYTNMTSGEAVASLIAGARSQMSSPKRLLLVCEEASCTAVQDSGVTDCSGLVFLNVPYADDTRLTKGKRESWQQLKIPSLILQEHPFGWPRDLALPVGFELHLLPMGASGQKNSRVMRKIRGWLKRQLGVN